MQTTTPSLLATKGAVILVQIQQWPHWEEIGKVALKEYGITSEEYAKVLPEYQRFLTLVLLDTYPGLGMFSPRVDAIWHSHILSTHRYQDFCEQYYQGRTIHHLPCLEPKPRNDCSTCNTCYECNATCDSGQKCPDELEYREPEGPGAPGSLEHFQQAYREVFGCEPPSVWNLPREKAEGFVG